MEKTKYIRQIPLEPNYYYHLGFPFNLEAADSAVFKKDITLDSLLQ